MIARRNKETRMSTVHEILHEIEAPGEKERLQLERALNRRLEAQWTHEVTNARKTAKSKKIDQSATDRAIEQRRLSSIKVFPDTHVYIAEGVPWGEAASRIIAAIRRGMDF